METDDRFADEGVILTTGEIISYDEFFRRQDERRDTLLAAIIEVIENESDSTVAAYRVIELVRDRDRRS